VLTSRSGTYSAGADVAAQAAELVRSAQKQVELLTEAFPKRTKVVALYDALSADQFMAAKRVAEVMKLEIRGLKLENPPYDYDAAFRVLGQDPSLMLLVLSSPHFTPSQSRIAALAIEQRLPTMFTFKNYVEAEGLCPMAWILSPCTAELLPL